MELKQGACVRSTAAMNDPNFKDVIILITELNEDGAIGFIINQPFNRKLNELMEFSFSKPFPLHKGGPVDPEHLYFIHRQPSLIADGVPVADGLYTGGHFKQAVEAIDVGLLTADDIKIFVGYCGWDTGELEAEIRKGSWEIIEFAIDTIFH